MRNVLLILSIFSSGLAWGEFGSSVTLTSDYIWRGQTQTAHDSAAQGSLEYTHSFATVGAWMSSLGGGTGTSGTETDLYASFSHSLTEDITAGVGVTYFTYSKASANNTLEPNITVSSPWADVFVGHTGDYFNSKSSSMYFNLSHNCKWDEKNIGLSLAVGYTTFDDERKVGSENYMDYKVGLTRSVDGFDFEMFYTDTNRKTISGTTTANTKDSNVGISVTRGI